MTRRQWLLHLGQGTVLAGFSGEVTAAPDLPPGLYEPNLNHLTHVLAGKTASVPVRPESLFFSPDEFQIVRSVAGVTLGEAPQSGIIAEICQWLDLMVSEAGTVRNTARSLAPLHRIVAVHYYGAEAVRELETANPQKICREGLAWLAEESRRRYGKPFASVIEPQQIDLLQFASEQNPETEGTHFVRFIRARCIEGFYTSRMGLTELDYKGNSFYATPPGCTHANHA